ncbi:Protein POLLEN DEFECTIVE IN GUIDANCE 1 [Arabidopsis thaliana]
MTIRSSGRKLSFEILSQNSSFENDDTSIRRSSSDPITGNEASESPRDYGKRKRSKKKKKKVNQVETILENGDSHSTIITGSSGDFGETTTMFENRLNYYGGGGSGSSGGGCVVTLLDGQTVHHNGFNFGELRQRNVNGSIDGSNDERWSDTLSSDKKLYMEETSVELSPSENPPFQEVQHQFPRSEINGNVVRRLDTEASLDWKQLVADDPDFLSAETRSPMKYFMEEIYGGISLRSTTTPGNDIERERIYDTIFRLPWRCEVLIDTGFFVCVNSFLSLLTVMPIRVLLIFMDAFKNRQFRRPSASELSDLACFLVLATGTILLGRTGVLIKVMGKWILKQFPCVFLFVSTDISLIYHMIRGQSTIKLYVVYNILEIFDRLCQSFCGDVFGALFSSAKGLSISPPEKLRFSTWRFAITLSTCIVAHNNALLALLVSNNFAEIKSSVFKRFSKDNIHGLVYADSIERFHISAFLVSVLAQNILESEGAWFGNFIYNATTVFFCEMMIDIIKHSFLAKFNDIKPIAYSEFLQALCEQVWIIQPFSLSLVLLHWPYKMPLLRHLTSIYLSLVLSDFEHSSGR